MPLITPDFSDVKDKVEPGTYKVRVTGVTGGEWADKGKGATPYVRWELETFGEASEKNNGRKIFHSTPVTGPGAFRLKDFYKGVMGEELGGEFDTDMLLGKECQVLIDWQKGRDGQISDYTEVKSVKPIG